MVCLNSRVVFKQSPEMSTGGEIGKREDGRMEYGLVAGSGRER